MIAAGTCAKNVIVGQVAEEYERLVKAVAEMAEVSACLADKLHPVLACEQPKPDKECSPLMVGLCPLAAALRDQRFRLESTINLIANVNGRVEL